MAPPPPSLPLTQRLLHLAQTLQSVITKASGTAIIRLLLTDLGGLLATSRYFFALSAMDSRTSAFTHTLDGLNSRIEPLSSRQQPRTASWSTRLTVHVRAR
jgi:hypothetical protein